ncbi:hypothetical protein JKP88DRAFT_268325 [Tribonema minus]|uniref:Uncharacterized protein n=1 Tax=Tribonema minus TaxID=303371 RepID=A0A835ZAQ5_9STRA|nr:hypothetical protein JKP88DRAFT_268325 [Tribonema minus]
MSEQLAAADAGAEAAHSELAAAHDAAGAAAAAAAAAHLLARALPPLLRRANRLAAAYACAAAACRRCRCAAARRRDARLSAELAQLAAALGSGGSGGGDDAFAAALSTGGQCSPSRAGGCSERQRASLRAAVVCVVAANRLARLGAAARAAGHTYPSPSPGAPLALAPASAVRHLSAADLQRAMAKAARAGAAAAAAGGSADAAAAATCVSLARRLLRAPHAAADLAAAPPLPGNNGGGCGSGGGGGSGLIAALAAGLQRWQRRQRCGVDGGAAAEAVAACSATVPHRSSAQAELHAAEARAAHSGLECDQHKRTAQQMMRMLVRCVSAFLTHRCMRHAGAMQAQTQLDELRAAVARLEERLLLLTSEAAGMVPAAQLAQAESALTQAQHDAHSLGLQVNKLQLELRRVQEQQAESTKYIMIQEPQGVMCVDQVQQLYFPECIANPQDLVQFETALSPAAF